MVPSARPCTLPGTLVEITRRGNRRHAAEQRDELAPCHAERGASSPPGGIPSPSHLSARRALECPP